MDNVTQISVIRQLLSFLPLDMQERSLFDRYTKKLTISKAIFLFILASLNRWSSYGDIEMKLRSQPELQATLDLETISGSQLSRKLDQIPTEMLQWLFLQNVALIQQRSGAPNGITARIGKLAIIDSTSIKLPLHLGDWARMSHKDSGIKLHLRLITDSPDTVYPDSMIPSTRNVDDRKGAVELVVESDATYVLDRGYDDYGRMDKWVEDHINFVMRIRDRAATTLLEEVPVPENSRITRDAKVLLGSTFRSMQKPVRLIEFTDEQGRLYRIVTSRWDVTAEEIAHIYKCRWLIELFFKWMKQHVRLVKVYSYKPQALWNQAFIALIVYTLVLYIKMHYAIQQTSWKVLQFLQTYLFHHWDQLEKELHRPTRKSLGRKPGSPPQAKGARTTIGIIKERK